MTPFEHCVIRLWERGKERRCDAYSGATAFLSLYLLQACRMTVPQAAQWSKTVAILVFITTSALLLVSQFTVYAPLTARVRTQSSIGTYVTYERHAHASRARGAWILYCHFLIAFQPRPLLDPSSRACIASAKEEV